MNHKQLAIKALEQMKGDDLYRAQSAFAGMTNKELDAQYGESGKTRRQIVAEYKERDTAVDAAISWVKSLPLL